MPPDGELENLCVFVNIFDVYAGISESVYIGAGEIFSFHFSQTSTLIPHLVSLDETPLLA